MRPRGLTVLALALGWLALAGFVNAAAALLAPQPPFWSPTTAATNGALALLYGATALAAAIGIWRLKPWAILYLRIWIAVVLVMMVWFMLGPFSGGPLAGIVAFALLVVSLLWLLHRYASRKLSPALTS